MQKTIPDYIIDVLIPLVIYLFICLVSQAGFTVYMMIYQIQELGAGNVGYMESISFIENMEKLVSANTLTVTFISVAVACPILLYMYKKQVGDLRYSGITKNMYLSAVVGIFASAGISKLVMLFPIDGILGNYTETSSKVMEASVGLQIITLIVLGPIMEELLFRGIIYNRLKQFNDKAIAAYIGAIIFGVYHLNLVQGLYTFILALLLTYVYEKHKSLWAPIIMHMAANAAAVIIEYLPISKTINNNWFLKIPVMLIELAVLASVFYYKVYNTKEAKDVE